MIFIDLTLDDQVSSKHFCFVNTDWENCHTDLFRKNFRLQNSKIILKNWEPTFLKKSLLRVSKMMFVKLLKFVIRVSKKKMKATLRSFLMT